MNKKRLSVVMAGAMLATSVAPVLAAEEVVATEVQKGTLINELTNKLWEAPSFSNDSRNSNTGVLNATVDRSNKSVYTVKIDGVENADIYNLTVKTGNNANLKSDLQAKIQEEINKLPVGAKVELVALGYREVEEKGKKLVLASESTTTYTSEELENTNGVVYTALEAARKSNKTAFESIVEKHGYIAGKGYVIDLQKAAATTADMEEIVLNAGDTRLDFTNYIATNNAKKPLGSSVISDFVEFATADAKNVDIADKVEATYKIEKDGTTLALSDLFNGVMLTEKGQSLLNDAKAVKSVLAMKGKKAKDKHIVKSDAHVDLSDAIDATNADKNGVYKVKVQIAKATAVAEKIKGKSDEWEKRSESDYTTYYVTGSSRAELKKVLNWIDKLSADVDVLAGSNRYETAVKIAKEVGFTLNNSTNNHVVLVNGDSLVDGLAAAPLAAKKNNAPILLTESDKLPTATKKYLSELVDSVANKDITVSIVGGKSVVTTAVEKELRAMNLKVERFGGDNREETSMAVAKAVEPNLESAFVVGATGEADAMSIAGYAAQETTPIIVTGVHGLSDETVDELEDATLNVIGGEKAVSAEEFDALKSVALTVDRVAGANRKATNAAVINKFYNANFADTEAVVVAKDDVLIDALTASNLASVKHAPIVLGTNSLSAEQIDAVAKNAATTSKARKVYQVGYGVDRDNVVKLVAQSLGLI